MKKHPKDFIVMANFEDTIVLDGEKYGMSLPTKDLLNKLEAYMLEKYARKLWDGYNVPKNEDEALKLEAYSCRGGYLDNIQQTNAGEIGFDIFDDVSVFGEEEKTDLIATVKDNCKYSLQYIVKSNMSYRTDILWRPVLIPLDKDGNRDLSCTEPDGTITLGQTVFLTDVKTNLPFPIRPHVKYPQDIPYKTCYIGDTLQTRELQIAWMWIDGMLISMCALGEEHIKSLARKGHLFNRHLLSI